MQPKAAAGRTFNMVRPAIVLLMLLPLSPLAAGPADPADALVKEALAAEARLETRAALERYLEAERLRPNDPFILQRIARHYSDSEVDAGDPAEKRRLARLALDYSERAYALDPQDPEIVLSLAISHGKLALYSDTRTKIKYSRLVKQQAEQALSLDANYDWAHHVLGRWHYEVASLGAATRFFVDLIYGGLPDASPASAVRHLERAVDLAPETVAHHLELGFAYLAAGRPADARLAFERGLTLPTREKHDENAKRRAEAALRQLG
jgi:tetratricopeptide (TPR) repeat protein